MAIDRVKIKKPIGSPSGLPNCESCAGQGRRAPATPACRIAALRRPWIVVERCDTCEQYEDDLSAALGAYTIAGWFRCVDGGSHALADATSRAGARRVAGVAK